MKHDASMCYGARSGALRAPELAESPVLLILMLLFFCFFEAQLATHSDSRTCPKMAPKLVQNGSPNGSKIHQKSIPEPLRELLELSWQPGGLLGASWKPLGTLLDPKKHCLERPWTSPRADLRPFSAILGSKRLPKWSPEKSKIEL